MKLTQRTLSISCISIFTLILGVGGFGLWSRSQVEDLEVILMGNPARVPNSLVAKLPTRFSWIADKDLSFSIKTESPEDPRGLFVLDKEITNMDEVLEWAKQIGKKEIYFIYLPPSNPNGVPVRIDFRESLLNFFSPTRVWADTIPGPYCAEAASTFIPAGACTTKTASPSQDDNAFDGRLPSVKVCVMYSNKSCHYTRITAHLIDNAFLQNKHDCTLVDCLREGQPTSLADIMKEHNGSSNFKYPVNLTTRVYLQPSDLPCFQSSGCSEAAGCVDFVPAKQFPRRSVDKITNVAQSCEINDWCVNKHEILHTYGYTHADMGTGCDKYGSNFESSGHSVNSHNIR